MFTLSIFEIKDFKINNNHSLIISGTHSFKSLKKNNQKILYGNNLHIYEIGKEKKLSRYSNIRTEHSENHKLV